MKNVDDRQKAIDFSRAGICAECSFAKRIQSERGSIFWMCERSASDPGYAKYPRLPVMRCAGFSLKSAE
jgi:hypothetical protein